MIPWIYILLTLAVMIISLFRKDCEFRIVAITIFIGSRLTNMMYVQGGESWSNFNGWLAAIDLAAFLVFLMIALRSKSFWPLWIASLQLGALLSHFSSLLASGAVSYAIGVTASFWAWIQLGILLLVSIQSKNGAASPRA